MKANVLKALNEQWNAEYYSAYLYMAMSAYAEQAGFKGAANWLFEQAREEAAHAEHIYEHILERGGTPAFSDIKSPPVKYKNLKDVFAKVAEHEKRVTGMIDAIANLAQDERDHATYNFIMWFVDEQIEEVADAEDLLGKVTLIGDNPGALLSLDATLAQRKFKNPFHKD
ncbi:MAG: ferritin [Synergistaceae bacterium]|jgi:ferritin|nr:ferritin [Synergistaceae bacterium]